MEHSWVGPPGWRRREAARARLLPGHWPLGCTAALLAWPCARARPSRFPSQVSPRASGARRDPACPELPWKGRLRLAGWREGGQARRAQNQAWGLWDLLRAPASLAETPESWRGLGTLLHSRGSRDVAADQASVVSFFQCLGLAFLGCRTLVCSRRRGWSTAPQPCAKLTPSALSSFPQK